MSEFACPKCHSPYGYRDGQMYICPECFHEWSDADLEAAAASDKFLDAFGNELNDGDTVKTIKELKAGKETIPSGTKAKNIKLLTEPVNDHDISCKIQGMGQVYLKCSVVKKA